MNQMSDEQRIARLIDTGTDLDPNLVAAYIDGGLSPAERLALERRLAADPEAQLLARTLKERPNRARVWLPAAAIAATVLIGMFVWVKRDRPSLSLDERLVAVVATLRAQSGDLADFAMLSDDELTTVSGPKRGAGNWLHPRGVLLVAPREMRWQNPDDSERTHISLRGPGLNWSQEVEGMTVAAPAMGPGRYLVTMRALDSLAGQSLRRSFVIADATERQDLERAIETIRARADADIADLVVAHFAVRQRLYDVAVTAAESAKASSGAVQVAAERLLEHLGAAQGR